MENYNNNQFNDERDFSQTEYHFVPQKSENSEKVESERAEYQQILSGDTKKAKRKFSFASLLVCSVAAALVATIVSSSLSAWLITSRYDENAITPQNNNNNSASDTSQGNESDAGSGASSSIEITGVTESVIEAVAQKVNPSVVGIVTTEAAASFFGGNTETTGEGSGIVYTSDGYIITNYHVIESAVTSSNSGIEVYLSADANLSYDATVVGYNIAYDLAVIKIDAKNLTPVEFADSSELKVGQYVAAIGNPGGLQFMGSVTYGIISGLDRVVSDSATGASLQLIQTDAAINPGNSGGALVNTKGELVGVNSSKIAATAYEGMGFAIPSNTVKEICDNIIAKENDPNPYIGITISERYTADVLTQLGYPVGAVVKSVIGGGPAEKAGIRSGDIVVEYNSIKITEYTVLTEAIIDSNPGDTVTVKIYRSGRYYSTSLTVGSNNSQ